ncbi:MAG: SMP-30/gluconolactonase/LRE family protein [Asticcacaulis sp.]
MKDDNPLKHWQLDRADIGFVGKDLQRPECILAEKDGTLWSADARGGVVRIAPDGSQRIIAPVREQASSDATFENRFFNAQGSLPNGMTFDRNGDFLIANFGTDTLDRMTRDGVMTTMLDNIDGRPLGKCNFITRDSKGRLWLTVTTQLNPWTDHVKRMSHDGYIAVIDDKGARIVADGLCGTNELRFDANEEWLYVPETTAHRITRYRVHDDGRLTHREIYGPSDIGGFCDGIAFDAYGNLWSALVHNDRLIAITPEGDVVTILDDGNPEANKALDAAWRDRNMTTDVMAAAHGSLCPWMASLTFGGPDLQTVYLGSLRGDRIPFFRAPVAGLPMIYWDETHA